MFKSKPALQFALAAVCLLAGLALNTGYMPAAAQDEAVYLRVMHAAAAAPDVEVYINGEQVRQPRIFGLSYLWSLSDTFTATLALPAPAMDVDTLPPSGASGYDELSPGDYEVTFARAGADPSQALATLRVTLAPGRYTAILFDTPSGGFQAQLLVDHLTQDVSDDSLYHIINGLDEVIDVYIDEQETQSIADGAVWSEHYARGGAARLRIALGDVTLYDESTPSKAFLPRVMYTLAVIRLDGETGVLIHATTLQGISGVSSSDGDLMPDMTQTGEIAGRGADGSGYVERTHFMRLEQNTQVSITVTPAEGSRLDPYLRVIDVMTGALVAWNDDMDEASLAAGVADLWLPAGVYAVSVSGYAYGTAGEYTLVLTGRTED